MYDINYFPGSPNIFGKESLAPFLETAFGMVWEGHYKKSDFTANQSLMHRVKGMKPNLLYFSPSNHQSIQNFPLMGIWESHLFPSPSLLPRDIIKSCSYPLPFTLEFFTCDDFI